MTRKTIVILIFLPNFFFAQIRTNLEVIDSLLNLSIAKISEDLKSQKLNSADLTVDGSEDYNSLKTNIIKSLQNNEINIEEEQPKLNITLSDISVKYPEIEKDGLFGNYLVNREINFSGSYYINNNLFTSEVKDFNFYFSDKLPYDDVYKVENVAYSFTSAELPEEPVFESILEPVVAVGTAAVAAYLFFTVRSK